MKLQKVNNKINKKNLKIIKQNGGNNVVSASVDLINSMIDLGKSIFVEIDSISNIGNQLSNGAFPGEFPAKNQSPPKQSFPNL